MAKSRVKKRPDGRYMMQIYLGMVDGKRKYKSVYGATPKEVEAKAEEVRAMMGKGLDVAAMRDTFSSWAEHWLKLKKSTVSPAHYVTCAQKIETINQWLGPLCITEIRPADVQGMILDLSAQNPHTGKPTAKRTLVEYRSVVHQVCQMAIDNRLMDYNPASAVKIATEAPQERRRALTAEEQGWILNTPHRAQRAAMLMMLAGLRRGEVIPLTWVDVDLGAGMIRVNKSVAKVGTKFEVKAGAKTEAGERVVQIPKLLVDFLRQQPREGLLVCPDTKGQMMTETSWRRMWESYQKELNARYGNDGASRFTPGGLPQIIPNITPHMLRHTFCSLMYLAGVDALAAMEQMGHADLKTTLAIYTHLDQEHKRRNIEKLDKYLSGDASQMQVKEK